MKAKLTTYTTITGVSYECLLFVCPGCVDGGPDGYEGVHELPVNVEAEIGRPSWTWDGNLEAPTLSPSILSQGYKRCHSFLENGKFRFLVDSEHSLSGKSGVPMPDLPDWAVKLSDDNEEGTTNE